MRVNGQTTRELMRQRMREEAEQRAIGSLLREWFVADAALAAMTANPHVWDAPNSCALEVPVPLGNRLAA